MHITAGEWLDWILARIGRCDEAELPVELAHGRTLAADARSRHDLPLWNSSAMDGYALRAADTASASPAAPVRFEVAGEVLAGGSGDPPLVPGTAVRIMTGAPVPSEADAVVPVELTLGDGAPGARGSASGTRNDTDTAWDRDAVILSAPVSLGANVRLRGEDTPAGSLVARRGDALTAARLSALAAAGVATVRVGARPRVAVIVTGAELRAPGDALERGQIVESNSLLLAGLLRESGLDPVAVLRCPDDAGALRSHIDELASRCDVVITTGGIGPGSHDVVRLAAQDEPGVRAARVAIRPGQPQCAGRLAAGPWLFALPGNPVSAAVSFELFVRPALLAMQGRGSIERRRVPAVAEVAWRGAEGRLQVLPVMLSRGIRARPGGAGEHAKAADRDPAAGALLCRPAVNPRGVSHAVGGHGAVQGYALVGEDRGDVAAGDPVDVILVEP